LEIALAENAEDEAVRAVLTDALIRRSREIKAHHPDKRIVMAQYIDTDRLPELGYFLARGFAIYDTIVVFKYDLSREIPSSSR